MPKKIEVETVVCSLSAALSFLEEASLQFNFFSSMVDTFQNNT